MDKFITVKDHIAVFDSETMALNIKWRDAHKQTFSPINNTKTCATLQPLIPNHETYNQLFGHKSSNNIENAPSTRNHRYLGRLTLCVSNTCNMNCKYCYAHQGTYDRFKGMMNQKVALSIVNWLSHNFDKCSHIQFFGGEPTLNYKIIHLLCNYLAYLHKRGVLNTMPTFGITTNGLSISSSFIDFLAEWHFGVVVSVDGPPLIHDFLRPDRTGKNTFPRIAETVHLLREKHIPIGFECTYTKEHIRLGIQLVDLLSFFDEYFHCTVLHVPSVIGSQDSPWLLSEDEQFVQYAKCIQTSIRSLFDSRPRMISMVYRWLMAIAYRQPINDFCPAGVDSLTVTSDGIIYSCYMLMDNPIGNIYMDETNFKISIEKLRMNRTWLPRKDLSRHCHECWFRPLCFGCLGSELKYANSRFPEFDLHASCDTRRALGEIFLTELTSLFTSNRI